MFYSQGEIRCSKMLHNSCLLYVFVTFHRTQFHTNRMSIMHLLKESRRQIVGALFMAQVHITRSSTVYRIGLTITCSMMWWPMCKQTLNVRDQLPIGVAVTIPYWQFKLYLSDMSMQRQIALSHEDSGRSFVRPAHVISCCHESCSPCWVTYRWIGPPRSLWQERWPGHGDRSAATRIANDEGSSRSASSSVLFCSQMKSLWTALHKHCYLQSSLH